jgi:hypothetical protein
MRKISGQRGSVVHFYSFLFLIAQQHAIELIENAGVEADAGLLS